MNSVLLIEDDPLIARIIVHYLKQEETYEITWVKTGGEALFKAREHFDVILMDILLPDVNGIDLCERLRQWHDCPIIFLSCLDDSDTIVRALAVGGDDFLIKPFDNKVLAARIEANLRRSSMSKVFPISKNIEGSGLTLDTSSHTVKKNGSEITLSNTEYRLLLLLMTNAGKHFTPRELYKRVWGMSCEGDSRTVLVHIHNLRNKIEDNSNEPYYIRMDWGKGYTFYDGKAQKE